MKYLKFVAFCCAFFVLTACNSTPAVSEPHATTPAQTTIAATNTDHIETDSTAVTALDTYLRENEFQGAVLIARQGEILFKEGYGMADMANSIPNQPDTIFPIASLTKAFTASGIMQLQEEGKLQVNDPLSKYLPDLNVGDQITIHHLLTHLSGLPSEFENELWDDPVQRLQENLQIHFKLQFEPGESFLYSNVGYVILGHLIEKVSGQTYEDYMKEHIFEPLNMKRTFVESYIDLKLDDQAEGYENDFSGGDSPMDFFRSYPGPSGIVSTIEDLYLWDRALYSDQLLSKDSLATMFIDYAPTSDGYGYGWGIDNDIPGIYSHQGYIPGFNSYIRRDTGKQQTLIVLSNRGNFYGLFQESDVIELIDHIFEDQSLK